MRRSIGSSQTVFAAEGKVVRRRRKKGEEEEEEEE